MTETNDTSELLLEAHRCLQEKVKSYTYNGSSPRTEDAFRKLRDALFAERPEFKQFLVDFWFKICSSCGVTVMLMDWQLARYFAFYEISRQYDGSWTAIKPCRKVDIPVENRISVAMDDPTMDKYFNGRLHLDRGHRTATVSAVIG